MKPESIGSKVIAPLAEASYMADDTHAFSTFMPEMCMGDKVATKTQSDKIKERRI